MTAPVHPDQSPDLGDAPASIPVVADLLDAIERAVAAVRTGDPFAAADLDALERAAARVRGMK